MADKTAKSEIATLSESPKITIGDVSAEMVAAMAAAVAPSLAVDGLGKPSFSWPDKTYATKDGKTTTHARYTVPIMGTPFIIDAVIWRSLTTTDGNPTEEFSVGLPRGIVLGDAKSDDDRDKADAWKMQVLEAFDAWADGAGPSGARLKPRSAPRLVKRLKGEAVKGK